jgi:hypothetical protein
VFGIWYLVSGICIGIVARADGPAASFCATHATGTRSQEQLGAGALRPPPPPPPAHRGWWAAVVLVRTADAPRRQVSRAVGAWLLAVSN